MVNQDILVQLNKIIGENLAENNFELVEFTHRYEGKDLVFRLLVDKPQGGITMGECASLNRSLGQLLYEKDIIPVRYILEVSSSGLDRPLMSRKDFMRCLNKQAVFFLNDLVNGKCQCQGLICKVDQAIVSIQAPGEILEIPLIKINKAQLVI